MTDCDDATFHARLNAKHLQWVARDGAEKAAQAKAHYLQLFAEHKAEKAADEARTARNGSDSLEDLARRMRPTIDHIEEQMAEIKAMRRRLGQE